MNQFFCELWFINTVDLPAEWRRVANDNAVRKFWDRVPDRSNCKQSHQQLATTFCSGAKPPRWAPLLLKRFGVIQRV